MKFEFLMEESNRMMIFFGWMLVVWLLEFGFPLTSMKKRKIFPNMVLLLSVLVLNLLMASVFLIISDWTAKHQFGLFYWLGTGVWVNLIAGVLLLDFWGAWLVHFLMHKIPVLWKVHSIHHTDTMVDVTTSFRQHPVESLLRIGFLMSGMFIFGLPIWIVLIYQTISAFFAQLEHSNVNMGSNIDKALQWIIVTPNMHKIHHSVHQPETDSNFANIFSIWDRLFNTLKKREKYDEIVYGLDYINDGEKISTMELMKMPFKKTVTGEK